MNRPTSVFVLGIVNIVFAVLGLLGFAAMLFFLFVNGQSPFQVVADQGFEQAWPLVIQVLDFIASIVLLGSGIGMLRMRPWSRHAAVFYAGYAIVKTLISATLSIFMFGTYTEEMTAAGADKDFVLTLMIVGGVIGTGISLLHPMLLMYFMTRSHVIAAFGGTPIASSDPQLYERRSTVDSDNPYEPPTMIGPGEMPGSINAGEQVLEAVVPINNRSALLSYYTGLFSIFPVLGLPLALIAIIYGRRGLAKVKAHPEVHGKAHAWIGLVCGWIFGLFNLLLTGLIAIGIFAVMTDR